MFHCVFNFFKGVFDSVNVIALIKFLMLSRTLRNRVMRSLVMNGVIFLGVAMFFNYILSPYIRTTLDKEHPPSLSEIIERPLLLLYFVDFLDVVLLGPIYLVSNFVYGLIWNQDVAVYSCILARRRSAPPQGGFWGSFAMIGAIVGDEIFRFFLETVTRLLVFFVSTFMLSHVPTAGPWLVSILQFATLAWLAAFPSFLYVWQNCGRRIGECVSFVESHWSYFAGFGMPLAIAISFAPTWVGMAARAMALPLHIVISASRMPPADPFRLPIFSLSSVIVDSLFRVFFRVFFRRKWRKSGRKSQKIQPQQQQQ